MKRALRRPDTHFDDLLVAERPIGPSQERERCPVGAPSGSGLDSRGMSGLGEPRDRVEKGILPAIAKSGRADRRVRTDFPLGLEESPLILTRLSDSLYLFILRKMSRTHHKARQRISTESDSGWNWCIGTLAPSGTNAAKTCESQGPDLCTPHKSPPHLHGRLR